MKTIMQRNFSYIVLLMFVFLLPTCEHRILPAGQVLLQRLRKINAATITIDYGSPSVKGRTIWGDLVPMDWFGGQVPMRQQHLQQIKI